MSTTPLVNQPAQPSWLRRNLKWVIPVGCLAPLLLCGGCIVGIATMVFSTIKSSDAYAGALAKARQNAAVKALLGEPIEPGFWVTGNINISGSSGNADITIPISGPKGSATLRVVATKAGGRWDYSVLDCAPDNDPSATFSLLNPNSPASEAEMIY